MIFHGEIILHKYIQICKRLVFILIKFELQHMAGLTIQADRFFRESLEISEYLRDENGMAIDIWVWQVTLSVRGETTKL